MAAAAVVFAVFYAAGNSESSGSDDPYAGAGLVMLGLFAAPLTVLVAGPVMAKVLRLPYAALYLLPVIAGVVLVLIVVATMLNLNLALLVGVATPAVGNLLIGLTAVDRMD